MYPKISIIVPVYKVEQYIHECVNSILAQTFKDFELILIDDGSPDKSGKICDEYALKDSRVKVIHKKNDGPSATRNLGIKMAKGDYIGFVDSDDTIENDMYEKLYDLAIKSNAEIVTCGYKEINHFTGFTQISISPLNSKEIIEGTEIKENLEFLLTQNKYLGYASMCNKLYKKSFIDSHNILINEKIKIAEDLCFNLYAISKAKRICAINEALYIYRRINSESIMNKNEGSFYLILESRKELINTLKKINISNNVYQNYIKYENCKTIAQYIDRIKEVIDSNYRIREKYKIINQLFLNSILINLYATIVMNFLFLRQGF